MDNGGALSVDRTDDPLMQIRALPAELTRPSGVMVEPRRDRTPVRLLNANFQALSAEHQGPKSFITFEGRK